MKHGGEAMRVVADIERVSVVGLGKLGAPIAAALASRGFTVVGMDTDLSKVAAVQRGEPSVYEPGLGELLEQARPRLSATCDLAQATLSTDATLLIVPTPSDADGGFSLSHLLPVCQALGQALRKKSGYHLVVVTSTVMPGATGGPIREALELYSGKKAGRDFGLCYSPEFVALGSVIRDFLHPDFVLIGESDPIAGAQLESIALRAAITRPRVARMNWVNAELAKISVNAYITTKITFANMIAGVCQNTPGGDADVVTAAIGLDSRIGPRYLKGAIGYGGPCFPRDNNALATLAQQRGGDPQLPQTVHRCNLRMIDRLAQLVDSHLQAGQCVGVLGLAYKPNTDVVEQSQGVMLARYLADRGVEVIVHDPAAVATTRRVLGDRVQYAMDIDDALQAADVLVLTTPWDAYRRLDAARLGRPNSPRTVIDCWRCLDRAALGDAVRYVAVGVGPAASTAPYAALPRVA
jgi:UDPglucose 6-dehydrogenase